MKIRKANSLDAEVISGLIVPLTKKFVLPTCDDQAHDVLVDSMSAESLKGYLAQGYFYLIAESSSGEVVGVIGIRDYSHIHHLFVSERLAGQGLARQLWETAKQECLANGNRGEFSVNSALKAEVVYLAFGFERRDAVCTHQGVTYIPMRLKEVCAE